MAPSQQRLTFPGFPLGYLKWALLSCYDTRRAPRVGGCAAEPSEPRQGWKAATVRCGLRVSQRAGPRRLSGIEQLVLCGGETRGVRLTAGS